VLVIGLDPGILRTGVVAINDGAVLKVCTIAVEGDPKDTGPRYAYLRRSLALVRGRLIPDIIPQIVAVEIPDEDEGEDGLREGREKMDVAKLYGAYAVLYAESTRLWPTARVVSVTPSQWKGPYPKELTARRMEARYGRKCSNQHEWDACGIADWAVPLAAAPQKNLTPPSDQRV
jgi:hypothetical protein